MIPISKASIFEEKGTERQTPGEAILTRLCSLTAAKAFVAPLVTALATVLFAPSLTIAEQKLTQTRAATVIDHVPYTITAPGVYELQSDLSVQGTNGIDVNADHVV